MTQYGLPFDGLLVGDATKAPYSADEWARQWLLRHGVGTVFPNYGVFKGTGDGTYEALGVYQTTVASTNVEVKTGAALVNGRFYENTAAELLAVAANASGNPRIDTVVLRADYIARTIRLVLLQGTPAASPVRPTLTQNASTWEMPLADIAVANGFATITRANITPRQRSVLASTAGWAPYAYQLGGQPVGAVSASSVGISSTNALAVPIDVQGNMLLQALTLRLTTDQYNITFGLYTQDVNDGNTAENTLRLLAQGSQTAAGAGTPTNVTINFSPVAVFIPPGIYWLVIRNDGGGTISIVSYAPTDFEASVNRGQNHPSTISITQTIDMVTGWSTKFSDVLMLRLKGRVFGQTTAF